MPSPCCCMLCKHVHVCERVSSESGSPVPPAVCYVSVYMCASGCPQSPGAQSLLLFAMYACTCVRVGVHRVREPSPSCCLVTTTAPLICSTSTSLSRNCSTRPSTSASRGRCIAYTARSVDDSNHCESQILQVYADDN